MEEAYRRSGDADISPENTAQYASSYAFCLLKLGRYEDALKPLHVGRARVMSGPSDQRQLLVPLAAALAEACAGLGQSDEAAKWRAELAALQAATRPATQPTTQGAALAP